MKVKFLVTWVENPSFIRGQTCQTREDADRLYDHVKTLASTRYAEIRRIGDKLRTYVARDNGTSLESIEGNKQ